MSIRLSLVRTFPLLFSLLILFCSLPAPSIGQAPVRIGPVFGFGLNHHTFGMPAADVPEAPTYPAHLDPGVTFGLQGQYTFNPVWSISAGIAYNDLSGDDELRVINPQGDWYAIEYFSDGPTFPDTSGDRIFLHTLSVNYRSLSLSLSGQWRFVADSALSLGIEVGPVFHLFTQRTMRQYMDIEEPLSARLVNPAGFPAENNGRRLFFFDDDIPESNAFRLGAAAGIFAEFGNRDSGTVVSPGLYYEYGVTPVGGTSDWRVHRFGLRLHLLFRL